MVIFRPELLGHQLISSEINKICIKINVLSRILFLKDLPEEKKRIVLDIFNIILTYCITIRLVKLGCHMLLNLLEKYLINLESTSTIFCTLFVLYPKCKIVVGTYWQWPLVCRLCKINAKELILNLHKTVKIAPEFFYFHHILYFPHYKAHLYHNILTLEIALLLRRRPLTMVAMIHTVYKAQLAYKAHCRFLRQLKTFRCAL